MRVETHMRTEGAPRVSLLSIALEYLVFHTIFWYEIICENRSCLQLIVIVGKALILINTQIDLEPSRS